MDDIETGERHEEAKPIGKAPLHLWIVGILALIWNAFGAWDYLQTQQGNVDYISAAMEPMGIAVADAVAYYDSFPVWADAAWALGVWGAVLGSILLLLRKRWAIMAFTISLFGIVVMTLYGIAVPLDGANDSTIAIVFSVVLWVITIALILYSRRMAMRNVLR